MTVPPEPSRPTPPASLSPPKNLESLLLPLSRGAEAPASSRTPLL